MSKWLIGFSVVIALLVVTGLLVKKSVRAEIVVAAAPGEVWATITNPSTYGEWNPIFVAYEGTFAEEPLRLQMKLGQEALFRST